MLDLALIDLLATRLEAASAAGGWLDSTGSPYGVSQKMQPTQQGITTDPQVYFQKLFDIPFGYAEVTHSPDPSGEYQMIEREEQAMQTTFQISAMVIQNPADLTIPTASDVVLFVRSFLMARETVRLFIKSGANVLRVGDVQNPYFQDDRSLNEASPSFDIVITHSRVIENRIGSIIKVEDIDLGIHRV